MDDDLIESLRRAVEALPDDLPLRVHFGRVLLASGYTDAALIVASESLRRDPQSAPARELMASILAGQGNDSLPETTFDWRQAEAQLGQKAIERGEHSRRFVLEASDVTLDDVAGMDQVKSRLQAAFLAPLRNPELSQAYEKGLRGGLLMYGPPGCGKTFIARAMAGELGATFLSASIANILDPYVGVSERNIHEIFYTARSSSPCLVFLDELDGLGRRRSSSGSSVMSAVTNQLLTELDGIQSRNHGVFVLAASNRPWDIDPALRRSGRLDRTVLVRPPDGPARTALFTKHLERRPTGPLDFAALSRAAAGLSGADIAYMCELGAERALAEGLRGGHERPISMGDLHHALSEVVSSVDPWMATAQNIVTFGHDDGTHGELREFLRLRRRRR